MEVYKIRQISYPGKVIVCARFIINSSKFNKGLALIFVNFKDL